MMFSDFSIGEIPKIGCSDWNSLNLLYIRIIPSFLFFGNRKAQRINGMSEILFCFSEFLASSKEKKYQGHKNDPTREKVVVHGR